MNKIENEFKGVVALTKKDFETLSTTGELKVDKDTTLIYDPLTTLYTIPDEFDSELNAESTNAIQNSVVTAKFTELDSTVDALDEKLTTVESSIETINTDIETINSTLEDLKGVTAESIGDLSALVSTNTANIATNTEKLNNIDQTVTEIINSMLPTVVDLSSIEFPEQDTESTQPDNNEEGGTE